MLHTFAGYIWILTTGSPPDTQWVRYFCFFISENFGSTCRNLTAVGGAQNFDMGLESRICKYINIHTFQDIMDIKMLVIFIWDARTTTSGSKTWLFHSEGWERKKSKCI